MNRPGIHGGTILCRKDGALWEDRRCPRTSSGSGRFRLVREWREARGVSEGGYTPVAEQLGIKRENRELRRANEILKSAAAFFGFM